MRAVVASVVLGCALLAGARGDEPRPRWLAVTLPVIAILHGELFVGEALAYLDRTGSIDVRAVLEPRARCSGRFRYTGPTTGLADMHCDDGAEAKLPFTTLSTFSGHGRGSTPAGPASFTFGLEPEEAAKHLELPPGKRLVRRGERLRLEPIRP